MPSVLRIVLPLAIGIGIGALSMALIQQKYQLPREPIDVYRDDLQQFDELLKDYLSGDSDRSHQAAEQFFQNVNALRFLSMVVLNHGSDYGPRP